MITYIHGNLFDSPAQTLVNPVNTVGVMGKGLAAQFKRRYPEMFEQYRELCKRGEFQVGDLWLYKAPDRWILNFPTKRHWRSDSTVEIIEKGLRVFVETYAQMGIESVAFPALGSGLGGLDFDAQVKPLMEQYLDDLPIEVSVYLRDGG